MPRDIQELGEAIGKAIARHGIELDVKSKPEPTPQEKGHLVDSPRFRLGLVAFEVIAIILGVIGIYMAADQTKIAVEALSDQKRMSAFQILYSDNIGITAKMESLAYLSKSESVLTGIDIYCRSYRLCSTYEDVRLSEISIGDGRISGIRLINPQFYPVIFENMDMRNVQFLGGQLGGLVIESDLSGVEFGGTDLSGTYFTASDLEEASMSGAGVTGTRFPGSNISGVELCTNSRYEGEDDWGCMSGADSETFTDSHYFANNPPKFAEHVPGLQGTWWECPPSSRTNPELGKDRYLPTCSRVSIP